MTEAESGQVGTDGLTFRYRHPEHQDAVAAVGGEREVAVKAKTINELFAEMDKMLPRAWVRVDIGACES